ncbi:MAG: efflux RND transporter periplasmic adaptor subunit [Pirellulaceae bacterium]|nr:efflux RND transporter periplasmic adaptor subunit [Pirellulaceae bacterium]
MSQRLFQRRVRLVVASALAIPPLVNGCGPAAAPATIESPATVATIAKESELNTITLTAEAEQHLALAVAAVELKAMPRVSTFGGEIMLPPGASLIVSAPFTGTLDEPVKDKGTPGPGDIVTAKQPIFKLQPLVTPEREALTPAEQVRYAEARNAIATAKIDASAQVEQALVQQEAARIGLERANRLFQDGAGTARAVDDAKALSQLAAKALEAAQFRRTLLNELKLNGDAATSQLPPILIEAPHAGMIRALNVAPGETVAAAAPLFEVMKFDPIWVRVPVYAGESAELQAAESATIRSLADKSTSPGVVAKKVAAPPSAVPLSTTVDLYFELPNPNGTYRPGERISAELPRKGEAESLVVPWSAIMHDIHGGTWLYEQTAERTYVRRRVQVQYVSGTSAVLKEGPKAGNKVVTAGVVELFGTEFGFAK